MSVQPIVSPIFYELTDAAGNQFLYQPAGPTLWYGPPSSTTQYTPTVVTSPLGSLVSVTLTPLTFPFIHHLTLVIPNVNMGNTPSTTSLVCGRMKYEQQHSTQSLTRCAAGIGSLFRTVCAAVPTTHQPRQYGALPHWAADRSAAQDR